MEDDVLTAEAMGNPSPIDSHTPESSVTLGSDSIATANQVFDNMTDRETETVPNVQAAKPIPTPPVKPLWSSMFKDKRDMPQGLKLTSYENQSSLVTLDDDDVDKIWGTCLIGYFVGKLPGNCAIQNLCKSWNVKYRFFIHTSGWLVFKFDSVEDRDNVLTGGPYSIYRRVLLLKEMPQCCEFDQVEICSMSVWTTLPGLPIELWNARCLGKIMSRVGKPIVTDKITRTKEKISYARVLVEVDFSKDTVNFVDMKLPNGKLRSQPIFYENTPKFCTKCRRIGHVADVCEIYKADTLRRVQGAKGLVEQPYVKKQEEKAAGESAEGLWDNVMPVEIAIERELLYRKKIEGLQKNINLEFFNHLLPLKGANGSCNNEKGKQKEK